MPYLKPSKLNIETGGASISPYNFNDYGPGNTSSAATLWGGTEGVSHFRAYFPPCAMTRATLTVLWELSTNCSIGYPTDLTGVVIEVLYKGEVKHTQNTWKGMSWAGIKTAQFQLYNWRAEDVTIRFSARRGLGNHRIHYMNLKIYDIWVDYVYDPPVIHSCFNPNTKLNSTVAFSGIFNNITSVKIKPPYTGAVHAVDFSIPAAGILHMNLRAVSTAADPRMPVVIENESGSASYTLNILYPNITGISQDVGPISTVRIYGRNFLNNIRSISIHPNGAGGAVLPYSILDDSNLDVYLQNVPNLPGGTHEIAVFSLEGTQTGKIYYRAVPAPQVSSHPSAVLLGETVVVRGNYFQDITSLKTSWGETVWYSTPSSQEIHFTAFKTSPDYVNFTLTTAGGQASFGLTIRKVAVSVNLPTYVLRGKSCYLQASVTGAANTGVTWSQRNNGHVGSVSGGTFNASQAGYTTIRATSVQDPTVYAEHNINVVEVPVASLTSPKSTITAGKSTTLIAVFNTSQASIGGIGNVPYGTPVSTGVLNSSTTYTLTATQVTGDAAHSSLTITVVPPPAIQSFTASKDVILYGESTYLHAAFTNGVGRINNGNTLSSGQPYATGPLYQTVTYTLTVTNPANDSVAQGRTIQVTQPELSPVTMPKSTLTYGIDTSVQCSASVTGALNPTVLWQGDLPVSATGLVTLPPQPANMIEAVGHGDTTYRDYRVVAVCAAKPEVTQSASIRMYALPRIHDIVLLNLVASPNNTFTPLHGLNPAFQVRDGWFNGKANLYKDGALMTENLKIGSLTYLGPIIKPTVYTVRVTNPAGYSVEKDWTFTPQTVVVDPIKYSVLYDNFVSVKDILLLSTEVTGAFSRDVSWSCTGGTIEPRGEAKAAWRAPEGAGTYTVTATSISDPSKAQSATFQVVPLPVIHSFTPDASLPVLYGWQVKLKPVYSGMLGKVGAQEIPHDGDWSDPNPSEVEVFIPDPLKLVRRFVLTVKNEAGATTTNTLDVTVQEVTLDPLIPAYVPTWTPDRATHQFTTQVHGAVDTGVMWSCSEGTIDENGLWTTPNHYGFYQITATSKANPQVAVSVTAHMPLQRRFITKKLSATVSSSN